MLSVRRQRAVLAKPQIEFRNLSVCAVRKVSLLRITCDLVRHFERN